MRKFELELAAEKTRVIPFSRYRRGETSFDLLGFEFRWGSDRKGQARLQRRTARKKFRGSIKRVAEWCKKNRHLRMKEQFRRLNAKLRGYYNYYGVNGNYASLNEFYHLRQHFAIFFAIFVTLGLKPSPITICAASDRTTPCNRRPW